jgi:hypothetical protein
MYSFAQREDTKVFDEPLYAHYLSQSNAKSYHPGVDDILESMENDGSKVVDMMMGEHPKKVVFFKNMTHHLLNLDKSFMNDMHNVILTRDPTEMLPSFARVIEKPTLEDVGYGQHIELVSYMKQQKIDPIVVDSKQILLDPENALIELCKTIDIPFDSSMLFWKKGARPEDGIWAKYWYSNIHNSTGFIDYEAKKEIFPEELRPLLNQCMPYYNQLMELAK